MSVKIAALEAENVKRIKAVALTQIGRASCRERV